MGARWSRAASADLARIFDFNAGRSIDHAERVDVLLLDRADTLCDRPAKGRPLGRGGLRMLSIAEIQYVLTYAIIGGDVVIFRVHSTRENREAT